MTRSDFDAKTALERDTLERALPLVAIQSDGSAHGVIDMAEATNTYFISAGDQIGANPSQCVDLLGIRPLLVGMAWKVLDILLEQALDAAQVPADGANGYRKIEKKVRDAGHVGAAPGVPGQAWTALMATFVATVELRHSLVHRQAYTTPTGALVGRDRAGHPLRPMTPIEQEAFGRAVLRAAQLATAAHPDDRGAADLIRQLALMGDLHGVPLQVVERLDMVPELTVILVPETAPNGTYLLDLPAVRHRTSLGTTSVAVLIIQFHGRPGQELRGRMENSPAEQMSIDPDQPPTWLAP